MKLNKFTALLMSTLMLTSYVDLTTFAQDTSEINTESNMSNEADEKFAYDITDEDLNNHDFGDLNFSSMRLIVNTDNNNLINKDTNVISSYNNTYILSFND